MPITQATGKLGANHRVVSINVMHDTVQGPLNRDSNDTNESQKSLHNFLFSF
jgi:hypothetical protein